MPKVTVWKCPHTGKLFEDSVKYKNHLSKVQRERRLRRKLEIDVKTAREWWDHAQNIEMSLEEFSAWIIANQSMFWKDAASHNRYDWDRVGKITRKKQVMPIPVLDSFQLFDLTWYDSVSNSHSCPHNGVSNWGGREKLKDGTDAPRGYPGWHGRLEWKCQWPEEFDGWYLPGDLFDGVDCRIHTGSGGGGGWKDGLMSHGYHVSIFAADWPGLARYREKQKVWKTLSDKDLDTMY